jgi:hypothetical protein
MKEPIQHGSDESDASACRLIGSAAGALAPRFLKLVLGNSDNTS